MTKIERLTAADQIMLWPDEIWPQDIGALAILDGVGLFDLDDRFRIEAVRKAVASRLDLVPRFRQLLEVPRRGLGGPLWVDAPQFDITEHVRVSPLPAPAGEAQLLLAIQQLRQVRMDRSRPLWEMWFLTGLPEHRVGLFMRTHHSIADGIAGMATFGAFLDAEPNPAPQSAQPWAPNPQPTPGDLRADYLRARAEASRRRLSGLLHPVRTLRGLRAAWPALRELIAENELPATSLDHLVSPERNFALIHSGIDSVKDVAHAQSAKINDVLLTVIAGGLRELLHSRGESVDDLVLRVYVPMTLRQGQFDGARGNQIAEMVVPLPIGVSDPVRRLQLIAAETAERKTRSRPALGKLPHRGMLGRWFLKLIDRQRVNVTTADLPGPGFPLYFLDAEILEVFPVLPLIGKVSLGIGAMSYAGQFNITVVGDGEGCPDIDVLAAGIRDELEALVAVSIGVGAAQTSR
jgi:WS/DGAT/MGAT family acyltransferase